MLKPQKLMAGVNRLSATIKLTRWNREREREGERCMVVEGLRGEREEWTLFRFLRSSVHITAAKWFPERLFRPQGQSMRVCVCELMAAE